jgi:hypothetical protein
LLATARWLCLPLPMGDPGPFCYSCGEPLTAGNRSLEHIIPEAIGGTLTSRTILCTSCNGRLGTSVDSALARAFGPLVVRLGIRASCGDSRGARVVDDVTGDEMVLALDGTTARKRTVVEASKGTFKVNAPSRKELVRSLSGVAKKRPDNAKQIQALIDSASPKSFPSTYGFNIDLNDDCHRAVSKMAVGFYLHNGGDRLHTAHLMPFITTGGENRNSRFYYPAIDPFPLREEGEVAHTLALEAVVGERLLVGYVELFSAFRWLIILDEAYDGPRVSTAHRIDLVGAGAATSSPWLGPIRENLDLLRSNQFQDMDRLGRATSLLITRAEEVSALRRSQLPVGR